MLKKRWLKLLASIGIVSFAIYKLYISDRLLVRKLISQGKYAVETGNIELCMSYISAEYSDNYRTTKKALETAAANFFAEFKNIKLKFLRRNVKYNKMFLPETAKIYIWLLIQASSRELGTFAGQEKVGIDIAKESDNHWRVVRLELLD